VRNTGTSQQEKSEIEKPKLPEAKQLCRAERSLSLRASIPWVVKLLIGKKQSGIKVTLGSIYHNKITRDLQTRFD
jgi:hypothetical protein